MLCRFCGNLAVVLADFLTINVNQAQKLIDTLASLYPILAYHKTPDTLTPNFDILNTLNKQTLGSLDQKSVAPDIPTKIMDAIAKDTHLSPSTIQKGFGILIQIFDFLPLMWSSKPCLMSKIFWVILSCNRYFLPPNKLTTKNTRIISHLSSIKYLILPKHLCLIALLFPIMRIWHPLPRLAWLCLCYRQIKP